MIKTLFYKILKKTGILKSIKVSSAITVRGTNFNIPIINGIGLENLLGLSEPWMLYILDRLIPILKNDKAIVDIGVNIGQTLIKVKAIEPTLQYIGFEPNPICINYLNSLISENRLINTEILPVGIGNKSSILKLKLFNNSEVDSSASIVEGFRSESSVIKTMNVPIFKFSDIPINNKSKIGIIKIDVEGGELEVIKGLSYILELDRPIILIEILPAYNKENLIRIKRQESIQELIFEFNYKILRIIKKNDNFYKIQEISEVGIHSDLNLCDYIFTPSELVENLKEALAN